MFFTQNDKKTKYLKKLDKIEEKILDLELQKADVIGHLASIEYLDGKKIITKRVKDEQVQSTKALLHGLEAETKEVKKIYKVLTDTNMDK